MPKAKTKTKTELQKGKEYPRHEIVCPVKETATPQERGEAIARLMTSPAYNATLVATAIKDEALANVLDIPGLMSVLENQSNAAAQGDTKVAVAMLQAQATALQSLFSQLVRKAQAQTHLPNLTGIMNLALRAQQQSARTLGIMSDILHPPVFAKTANFGQQQIVADQVTVNSRAQEKPIEPFQLSEGEVHELRPHTRASSHARRDDPAVEALGEVHRPED